jgi:dephospho-CoA kinase
MINGEPVAREAAQTGRVRVVGLTGGIASGKSTVARAFAALGAEVIDADQVARDVVAPGQPALDDIVRAFGREVLLPDGTLDRKRVAARVFADAEARRALNAITHPRIAAETARRIAEAAARGARLVVYEASLLVENGLHRGFEALVVVSLPPEDQVRRAVERDGMTADEARARLAAQLPLAEKVAAADYVIDNAGGPDETRRQVEAVWRDLLAGGPDRTPLTKG